MFRNLTRTLVSISILFVGMYSCVFAMGRLESKFSPLVPNLAKAADKGALTMSKVLDQSKDDVFDMKDIFAGKLVVKNLYSQTLKLAKGREITATTVSFDKLKQSYATCPGIENSDFLNVLYNSNISFKQTFKKILPKGTKKPSKEDIITSYKKFLSCQNLLDLKQEYIEAINYSINALYYREYRNTYDMNNLNENTYWSDFFRNGTMDDSAYDLLLDINRVGTLLFDNFKEAPEILFYRLPKAPTTPIVNGGGNLSSLDDQSSSPLWPTASDIPTQPSTPWSTDNATDNPSSDNPSESNATPRIAPLVTDDQEIQQLIDRTTPPLAIKDSTSVPLVLWNQCLISDVAEEEPIVEEEPTITNEEYIAEIEAFIENADVNQVVNAAALATFHERYPLPTWASTSDSWYAEAIATAYAEQVMGDNPAPWSCEYWCKDKPLGEQMTCQYECAKWCVNTCKIEKNISMISCQNIYTNTQTDCENSDFSWVKEQKCKLDAGKAHTTCTLGVTTKQALCISDCACGMIAGPNGAGRENVEDMYRLKFCKVPVQPVSLSPWKTVFSVQSIFQEISDVLESLRDSGQNVKYSKTKEYLDSSIKLNFADNFIFKIVVGIKPVFTQKSTTIKLQEEKQASTDINIGVLDMNVSAPEADNYNKYVVVSDVAANEATLQQASSLADIKDNLAKFEDSAESYNAFSNDITEAIKKDYEKDIGIMFVQNMRDFLKSNIEFWNNVAWTMMDINKYAFELKTKIDNAK